MIFEILRVDGERGGGERDGERRREQRGRMEGEWGVGGGGERNEEKRKGKSREERGIGETERQTDRQTDKQTDRQTETETERRRQRERQTERRRRRRGNGRVTDRNIRKCGRLGKKRRKTVLANKCKKDRFNLATGNIHDARATSPFSCP